MGIGLWGWEGCVDYGGVIMGIRWVSIEHGWMGWVSGLCRGWMGQLSVCSLGMVLLPARTKKSCWMVTLHPGFVTDSLHTI